MNYYPFHIGDYASATRHLSWDEDAAYRRLMDVYYTTEKALPLDRAKLYRLVIATSKVQREAVDVVLEEFFKESPDGWRNVRCDEELESMQAKQDSLSEKDQHEKDRMQRYRERRSTMFAALREREIVPAYDVPMKELQRLFNENCNEPETDLQQTCNVAGNAPATAIPIPTPTPIPIPTPIVKEPNGSVGKTDIPACRTQSVIDLFHEVLPELPKAKLLSDKRKKAIGSFWKWVLTSKKSDETRRAETAEQALAWIRSYFERARDNDFLMGRTPRNGEHANWQCDIDFLLTDKGMKQVIEKTGGGS